MVYKDGSGGRDRKEMATQVMMLWKYKPLDQDDVL
jgi:hypothetical protein